MVHLRIFKKSKLIHYNQQEIKLGVNDFYHSLEYISHNNISRTNIKANKTKLKQTQTKHSHNKTHKHFHKNKQHIHNTNHRNTQKINIRFKIWLSNLNHNEMLLNNCYKGTIKYIEISFYHNEILLNTFQLIPCVLKKQRRIHHKKRKRMSYLTAVNNCYVQFGLSPFKSKAFRNFLQECFEFVKPVNQNWSSTYDTMNRIWCCKWRTNHWNNPCHRTKISEILQNVDIECFNVFPEMIKLIEEYCPFVYCIEVSADFDPLNKYRRFSKYVGDIKQHKRMYPQYVEMNDGTKCLLHSHAFAVNVDKFSNLNKILFNCTI
eukprot:54954_1